MAAPIAIHLEFGGGAELLFNGVKEHHVTLPSQSGPWGGKYQKKEDGKRWKEMKERKRGGGQGELDYQLQDQDNVVFISTLHGG
ncbi:Ubiquitin-related modifier 1 [Larimichthys crocea]|uniref:Uncharacterized protein n=1 Tax=Larimichthys crocea TaxID=215358 RepID=A0ACD3QNC6_LARCR|nr:Ubiquitin-related modifier 1 [Larimichthys crocea]